MLAAGDSVRSGARPNIAVPISTGRAKGVIDAWIASTAIAHSAAVCRQDADFDAARDTGLVDVVRV